ncbi:hypothetical protein, partial [Microcoleus sp. M2_C2]|uniref:hypothetical protein n=1 Tax=Microcoleus sp. M2_C2 TaxID=3055369 RepID=UPI002FCE805D
ISCATGILPVANNLEQARCLFHKIKQFLVQQASCLLPTIWNRQNACSTKSSNFLCNRHLACCQQSGTGKMPVPQNQSGTGILPVANNLEQARCLFHKIKVQQASCLLPTQAQHLPR